MRLRRYFAVIREGGCKPQSKREVLGRLAIAGIFPGRGAVQRIARGPRRTGHLKAQGRLSRDSQAPTRLAVAQRIPQYTVAGFASGKIRQERTATGHVEEGGVIGRPCLAPGAPGFSLDLALDLFGQLASQGRAKRDAASSGARQAMADRTLATDRGACMGGRVVLERTLWPCRGGLTVHPAWLSVGDHILDIISAAA